MSGEGFFEVHARLTKKAAARLASPAAQGGSAPALTVTQLTGIIETAIKAGVPSSVVVRGEVSNCSYHRASGHLYFTLKDANSCIDSVMFRDSVGKMKFEISDGMELIATGRVGVYGPRGKYQFYASAMQPVGQGALELAFRQLQAKLEARGLFATERKKTIPAYPTRIVLVTSRSTAALQDMLKVLRRFSWLKLMVYDVPVQGEGSGARIAEAIGHINRSAEKIGRPDVIILARGGGSLEDLWAFNEEAVALAIAASTIPVVTGIGHEVDCSIADLVADYHAHTPTEAAQIVTGHWKQARDDIDLMGVRLRRGIVQLLADARQRLQAIERHENFRRPMDRIQFFRQLLDDRQRSITLAVTQRMQLLQRKLFDRDSRLRHLGNEKLRAAEARLSRAKAMLQESHPRHQIRLANERLVSLSNRLSSSMRQNLKTEAARVETCNRQLRALGPEQVLKRGYTITTLKKTGAILRSIVQIRDGDRIRTRLADGEAESIAQDPRQLPLFE